MIEILNTMIIENEEEHLIHLQNLIVKNHPEMHIIGTCVSGEKALSMLQEIHPDLILLDIDLGDLNAFDLLEKLPAHNFKIIFTTAYDEYALEAFRVHAVDYLLKPIDKEDLREAISRIIKQPVKLNNRQSLINSCRSLNSVFLALYEKKRVSYIPINNILYLEADRSYTIVHFTKNNQREKRLVTGSLSGYEAELSSLHFIRIHQSCLVNVNQIEEFDKSSGKLLLACGDRVPVARSRRELFERR